MSEVSIQDLRNHVDDIVDRAARGERLTITRGGKPVAELRSLGREPLSLETLVARHRHLPPVDPDRLRIDLGRILDPTL